jgi:hypothetical protein
VLLDVTKADSLLVPTATSIVGTPSPPNLGQSTVDDYRCYKTKISKGAAKFPRTLEITAADALTNASGRYLVKKPRALCTPTNVNGAGTHHTSYQLCYVVKLAKARCADGAPANPGASCKSELDCGGAKKITTFCQKQPKLASVPGIFTANQFDTEHVDARKAIDLCLPSDRIVAQ